MTNKDPNPRTPSSADAELQLIRESFITESQEELSQMETMLLRLEKAPADDETLKSMFRVMHTIKGNATALDCPKVAEMAHASESLLTKFRDGVLQINKPLISLLLNAVDALRKLTVQSIMDPEHIPSYPKILQRLADEIAKAGTTAIPAPKSPTKTSKAPVPAEPTKTTEPAPEATAPPASAHEPVEPEETINNEPTAMWAAHSKSLRIGIDKVNHLMTLMGEIVIAQEQLQQMLETRLDAEQGDILETFQRTKTLSVDLHEQISKIRMIPIGAMFRQQARGIRDLCEKLGKQAELVVEGGESQADTFMIDQLRDPILHMIRNAMDHGIEPPDVRQQAGKNPAGKITLSAFHESNEIVIEVKDDGAGFNRQKILDRAFALGMIQDRNLSDTEIFRLTFAHGFSTAASVTDTSGRGVGMDVVFKNIESLHGSIAVKSRQGIGTTISLRLPLTLAIIDGFAIQVSGDTYVIPLNVVSECLELPKGSQNHPNGLGTLNLRGEVLPYLHLRNYFQRATTSKPAAESVVVVSYKDTRIGLVADALLGKLQAVIKPLGKIFDGLPGISGSTILGKGQVALILDIPGIMDNILHEESSKPKENS